MTERDRLVKEGIVDPSRSCCLDDRITVEKGGAAMDAGTDGSSGSSRYADRLL